jgi:hypothetical protein
MQGVAVERPKLGLLGWLDPNLRGLEEGSVKASREGVRVGTVLAYGVRPSLNATYEAPHKHQPFAAL